MSETRLCFRCGTQYVGLWAFRQLCPVCQQTESLEHQAELTRRQTLEIYQQQSFQQNNQQAFEHDQRKKATQAYIDTLEQMREALISSDEARLYGRNYIDNEFASANPANLRANITEIGTVAFQWDNIYKSLRLQTEFRNGLQEAINEWAHISPDEEYLIASAKQAGIEVANGTLPPRFGLHTNFAAIHGVPINTDTFDCWLQRVIDEDTGELKLTWNKPFTKQELNQSFEDGINEALVSLNTTEQKNIRLATEVVAIKKERKIKHQEENISILWRTLIICFPFLGWYFAWMSTEGLITFLNFVIIVPILEIILIRLHEKWEVSPNY